MERKTTLQDGDPVHARRALITPDVAAADLPADITAMSATVLSSAIRQRLVSCREVMAAYLSRIAALNGTYNALVSMLPDDDCMAYASGADQALDRGDYWGWMHGMPHGVKDLEDAIDLPTSYGSPIFAGTIAQRDALFVARIRAQGALIIAKTNVPEFGMGSQTYNRVFGATACAYDPALTAGGSSGGAASALALHLLPVADGSDFMGSLRNPAAYNNVIGFRPTQGRVPGDPAADLFFQQIGTAGPMGRNPEDTYRLLVTMAGRHSRTPLTLRDDLPPPDRLSPMDLKGLRIGWLGDLGGHLPMEPGILELCRSSLTQFSANGAVIEDCTISFDMDRLWRAWLNLRHWSRLAMKPLYDNLETRAQLKPEVIWEIESAFGLTVEAVFQSGMVRAAWYRTLNTLFETYDLLMLPSAQVFPFPKDQPWPTSIAGQPMDTYHRWMEVVIGPSLAGLPVVNIPAGFDNAGRPMGIQAIGPFGEDRQVLEFTQSHAAVTGHLDVHPQFP